MTELLPCPFCGGEARVQHQSRKLYGDVIDWYGVYCKKQFCGYVSGQSTEAEAIAAWNTRAERTCHYKEHDALVMLSCDVCGHGSLHRPNYCPNCGARVVGE